MTDAAVTVRGVAKRFGEVSALNGIDFDVPQGSVFGLLGPNGSGKTTMVRVLTTIISRIAVRPACWAWTSSGTQPQCGSMSGSPVKRLPSMRTSPAPRTCA